MILRVQDKDLALVASLMNGLANCCYRPNPALIFSSRIFLLWISYRYFSRY